MSTWTITIPDIFKHCGLAVIEEIGAVLCIECRHCIQWNHLGGHLKEQHKYFALNNRDVATFAEEQGLCRTAKDIIEGVVASQQFSQCAVLAQKDGWWCEECGYATESGRMANEHRQRQDHFSSHYVVVNGDRYLRQRDVIAGTVQSLFPVKLGGLIPSIPKPVQEEISASDLFEDLIATEKSLFEPTIIAQQDPRSVHPFIKISGFQSWIGPMKWDGVHDLQKRMVPDPAWGERLQQHCLKMMEHSFALCVPQNYMACCHINSPTYVLSDFVDPQNF